MTVKNSSRDWANFLVNLKPQTYTHELFHRSQLIDRAMIMHVYIKHYFSVDVHMCAIFP